MEIWNLVFIQDAGRRGPGDRRASFPTKNIDTGSSLERVATLLQDVDNVFETDLLRPAARGRGVALRQAARRRRARRRVARSDRGARAGDDVPDRGRRAAVQRGARLHPAPRCSAAWSRTPAGSASTDRCMEPLVRRTVELMGDAYPELRRERVVRAAGRDVGGGAIRGHAPPGHDAVRAGGRAHAEVGRGAFPGDDGVQAVATRSGSRCS